MRPDPRAEGLRWLAQAERDLDDARAVREIGRFHLTCFLAQQSAEKALKAALYHAGEEEVFGHSVADLTRLAERKVPGLVALAGTGATLDKYYIPTRYPNGLPGGIPSDAYGPEDAELAIRTADRVLAAIRSAIRP